MWNMRVRRPRTSSDMCVNWRGSAYEIIKEGEAFMFKNRKRLSTYVSVLALILVVGVVYAFAIGTLNFSGSAALSAETKLSIVENGAITVGSVSVATGGTPVALQLPEIP